MNARRAGGIFRGLCLTIGALAVCGLAEAQDEIIVRTYNAQYTKAAPVIDGKLSTAEWNAAAETGEFLLLRTNPGEADGENTRWRALWDDEALYLLSQSDYGLWSAPPAEPGDISFGADNLNIYFDPNTDDEPNYPTDPEIVVADSTSADPPVVLRCRRCRFVAASLMRRLRVVHATVSPLSSSQAPHG